MDNGLLLRSLDIVFSVLIRIINLFEFLEGIW